MSAMNLDEHGPVNETVVETTEAPEDPMEIWTDPAYDNISNAEIGPSVDLDKAVLDSFKQNIAAVRQEQAIRDTGSTDSNLTQRVTVAVKPPKFAPLPHATSRTGLVYDVRMRFHCCLESVRDPSDEPHPEQPRRIIEIFNELQEAGLVEEPNDDPSESDYKLYRIPIRQATPSEVCLVHTPEHVRWVKSLDGWSMEELLAEKMDSVYLHNLSYMCASLAAGGAIEATRAVVAGQVRNAVAIIRPPGHHAEHNEPAGFCFFNNVPVAVRVAQQDFRDQCRKVLILDWDVHHGNGTQRTFYDDPNVLYISLHVHMDGRFYPPTNYGAHDMCGTGLGLGRNVNIPWKTSGMTDADYILAFQQIVMPIATEFDPDLVMISAGFDAANGDPLGECYVSPAGFSHMTYMLMQLANGRVVACLEGGYNLRSIAVSALAMTRTLMGEPPERLGDLQPTISGVETVQQVISTQSRFWKSLYPKHPPFNAREELGSQRLHDVMRDYQRLVLWDKHQMSPLMMLTNRLSKSLQNQVMATPDFQDAKPLLLILHDPPQSDTMVDPGSIGVDLHNIFVTDVAKTYIDWAVDHHFAVVDVNIPQHLTAGDDDYAYEKPEEEPFRRKLTQETILYLWENYVQIGLSSHVFILTIGEAPHAGVLDWLRDDPSNLNEITTIIGVVAGHSLRSLSDPNDESVSRNYFKNSLIFVSNNHDIWDPERKPKKRYGRIVRSPHNNLQDMLKSHIDSFGKQLLQDTQDWRAKHQTNNVNYSGDDTEEDLEVSVRKKMSVEPSLQPETPMIVEPSDLVPQHAIMDNQLIIPTDS